MATLSPLATEESTFSYLPRPYQEGFRELVVAEVRANAKARYGDVKPKDMGTTGLIDYVIAHGWASGNGDTGNLALGRAIKVIKSRGYETKTFKQAAYNTYRLRWDAALTSLLTKQAC